ncbi:MAG: replicative DNA helicase [Gemmataceae bacterium]
MSQDTRVADRVPPHNLDAEKSVLGSMLRDNRVISDLVQFLKAEDFYVFAHQKIYEAVTHLNIHAGVPVDPVTLANNVKEQGLLEDIGGPGYIVELWDAAPSSANAEYYGKIVRQKAILRSLIYACNDLLHDAYDQAMPAQELLDQAERRILEIAELGITGDTQTLQEAIMEAYARLESRKEKGHQEVSGIATGYVDLDSLTAGLQDSELIILAARPSVGKTSFALNVLRHIIVEEQKPVLFVSLEQARVEIAERLLCCQARVDSHKLRKGTLSSEDVEKLVEAGGILQRAKLFIDDTPGQSMLRIAANARRLKVRHDIKMVCIDYLQLIDPDDRRDSRQEQVAAISRRLKFLARELNVPVMALAQVNRGSEERQDHRPRLSDLRESGAIEQDADTVMILHRPDYHEPGQHEGVVEVIVAKQRNGPTGDVNLMFVKQYMRFENFAVEHSSAGGRFEGGYGDIPA